MSNTVIQLRRSSVAGRLPNTTNSANTQYINAGELGLNMTDQILYTSNGTVLITIGANQTFLAVTNSLSVGNTSTSNATINSTVISVGNAGTNTTINSTAIVTSNLTVTGTATFNASSLGIGNSTQNTYINSTGFYINGASLSGSFSNGTAYTWSAVETFNANVVLTGNATNEILLGNSTVNAVVNATGFYINGSAVTGGGSPPGGNNTDIQFANGVVLAGNDFFQFNYTTTTVSLGNSTVNATINSTVYSQTANNATNLNGQAASYYTNATNIATGTLPWAQAPSGTVNTSGAFTFAGVITHNANIALVGNTTALLLIGNTTVNAAINSTTVLLSDAGTNTYIQNTGTMTVGNTTVNTSINSTAFSGIANNATNLGGQAASYYTNATNIATGTLPNAQLSGQVVNTSGAFTFAGFITHNANLAIVGNTTAVLDIGQAAANIIANSTAIIIAVNSTFSTTINGTAISIGNSTVNTISNSTVETFGNSTVNTSVNATGFYINGTAIVSATLTANNTDTQTYYLGMSNAISGSWANAVIATTELYFVPSTGILSATGFNSLSDYTLKKNITPLLNPINTLCRIQGVSFNWIRTGRKSYGIIAQELEKILPDLVDTSEYGIKTINYAGIVPFLIEAIKELSDRVEILENAKP